MAGAPPKLGAVVTPAVAPDAPPSCAGSADAPPSCAAMADALSPPSCAGSGRRVRRCRASAGQLPAWAVGVTELDHLPKLRASSALLDIKASSITVMASFRGGGIRTVATANGRWPGDALYAVAAFDARLHLGRALVVGVLSAAILGVGSSQLIFHPNRKLTLCSGTLARAVGEKELEEDRLTALADGWRSSFLHTDVSSSLLIVFRGQKVVVLSRKRHSPGSPHALKNMLGHSAGRYLEGDALALAEAYPALYVTYTLTGQSCLFIPQGHVHCVYSLPGTLAISLDVEADAQFLCGVAHGLA